MATSFTTLSYQWYFNNHAVSGATDSTLTIANVPATDAGPYYVAVTNAGGGVNSSVATLTVLNHAPVAANDSYSTPEDTPLTNAAPGVLANDSDADGDPLTAVLVATVTHGTLTLNANGGFTYRPATNYHGSDSFTYKANDGTANSGVATVTLTITPVNDPPVAANQAVTIPEDTPTNLTLSAVDVDSTNLQYTILSGPTNGVLSVLNASSGAVTYLPATNFYGSDSFTFRVFDGSLHATGQVSLTITAVYDVPRVSMPATVTGTEDVPMVFAATNGNAISVSAPDSGTNAIELTLSVTNGTATLSRTNALIFTIGDGLRDTVMTFRGPLPNLNAALNGLTFTPSTNFNGTTTCAIKVDAEMLVALNYDPRLAGRYTFDNQGNGNALALDSSPASANNGKITGASAAVDVNRGNVLSLDGSGSGDYLKVIKRFGNPTNGTLAAWVKLTSAPTNGAEVISLGDSAALRLDDNGNLKGFFYNGSTWKEVTFPVTLAGAGWHHVAYTFDTANHYQKLYLDGVMVASQNNSGSISYVLGANSYIGVHGNGSTLHNFSGQMDDARVYTRALGAAEIATLAADLSLTTTNSTAMTFTPVNDPPVAMTLAASSKSTGSAVLNASVNPAGAATTCFFQCGLTTNYGWFSATNVLAPGAGDLSLAAPIAGLASGTLYHYRIVAANPDGTTRGQDVTFSTLSSAPFGFSGALNAPGSNMHLSLSNTPGSSFTVLTSTNLALPLSAWTVLGLMTESVPGFYQFTDPRSNTNSQFYYRIRSP